MENEERKDATLALARMMETIAAKIQRGELSGMEAEQIRGLYSKMAEVATEIEIHSEELAGV